MNNLDTAIDWQRCLELTNNNQELAKELLTLFANDLPNAHKLIMNAFKKKDYELLKNEIHKLHGACCYCGVPQLKSIVSDIESVLKTLKNLDHLDSKMKTLDDEIQRVMEALKQYD